MILFESDGDCDLKQCGEAALFSSIFLFVTEVIHRGQFDHISR